MWQPLHRLEQNDAGHRGHGAQLGPQDSEGLLAPEVVYDIVRRLDEEHPSTNIGSSGQLSNEKLVATPHVIPCLKRAHHDALGRDLLCHWHVEGMLSNPGQQMLHQCPTDLETGRRALTCDAHRGKTKSRSD